MRIKFLLAAALAVTAGGVAHADSQSSNTSSNSSSNNGVVRERIVDTYCENGYCQRYVARRVYRDDRKARRYRNYYTPYGYYYDPYAYYGGRYYRQRRGDDDD